MPLVTITQVNGQGRQAESASPKSVLARGLSLLDAFGSGEPELSLAEIAARSGLPKPTAHRLLGELVEWGALERGRRGHYRLATKLFRLGQLVPRSRLLRTAAQPHLEELLEASRENVHLAVPDNVYTLFLEKLAVRESMSIRSRVGGRMPSHCTATGKVFLAWGGRDRLRRVVDAGLPRLTPKTIVLPGLLHQDLQRTVVRGVGVNQEEAEPGVSAVAAPVLGPRGQVVAALSVTGHSHRVDLDRLGGAVRAAANALSRTLVGQARECSAGF